MNDLLEALTTVCAECGTDKEPAGWCPVWNVHLCFCCRAKRTDAEVKVTLAGREKQELPREPMVLL